MKLSESKRRIINEPTSFNSSVVSERSELKQTVVHEEFTEKQGPMSPLRNLGSELKVNLEAIDDVSDPELPMTLPPINKKLSSLMVNSDRLIEI